MSNFHNDEQRKLTDPTATLTADFDMNTAVEFLLGPCRKNNHVWVEEQQTKHRVCAWCNTCNDPECSP